MSIRCNICGIEFKNKEDYEKHLFHYEGGILCGVKFLRASERLLKLLRAVERLSRMTKEIDEIRKELEKARITEEDVKKAREKFYKAIEKVNKGEYDDVPIPGIVGEIKGGSPRPQGGDVE